MSTDSWKRLLLLVRSALVASVPSHARLVICSSLLCAIWAPSLYPSLAPKILFYDIWVARLRTKVADRSDGVICIPGFAAGNTPY